MDTWVTWRSSSFYMTDICECYASSCYMRCNYSSNLECCRQQDRTFIAREGSWRPFRRESHVTQLSMNLLDVVARNVYWQFGVLVRVEESVETGTDWCTTAAPPHDTGMMSYAPQPPAVFIRWSWVVRASIAAYLDYGLFPRIKLLAANCSCDHFCMLVAVDKITQHEQARRAHYPFSSDRQHLSYDKLSGGKRGDYHNCSVLYCVLKLCTVISTLSWAVLTVLWIGFCLTGPISLCLDSFVCVFFLCFSCHTAYVLYYCNTVGWTWWDWSLILEHLPSVLWHCWLGHLTRKNSSPIWPIMCFVGR